MYLSTVFNACLVFVFLLCSVLQSKKLSKHPGLKDTLVQMEASGVPSPFLFSVLGELYEEELAEETVDKDTVLEKALKVPHVIAEVPLVGL